MQEVIHDELPEIVCVSANKARMICVSEKCTNNGLICLRQDCQACQNNHLYCQTYRIKILVEQLRSKRQVANVQVLKACEQLKKCLDEAIERVSIDKEQIGDQMEMYGLNEHEASLYKLLKEQRLSEITGKITSKALSNINQKLDLNITEQGVKRYWTKRKVDFSKIFDNFKLLLKKKYIKLESVITDELSIIESFFQKPIYQFKLLYRGSENNFLVSTFHQKCDNIPNTIVLAKTQFGKIIGGFTPLRWNSYGNYIIDDMSKTDRTFLFSISQQEKYDMVNQSDTIYGNSSYGPTFGGGHDFYIANYSSTADSTSYFNFPYTFNNGKHTNGQASYTAFTGSANGSYYAKVMEWEVFEIDFL